MPNSEHVPDKFTTSIAVPLDLWRQIERKFLTLKESGKIPQGTKRNSFLVDLLSKGFALTEDGGRYGAQ